MYVVLVSSIAILAKRNNAELFDGIEVLIYCSLALLFDNVHKSDYVRARVLGEPFKVITLSAYLRRLACLAIDKPADVVIGKALRDTPWEHTLQLKAQAAVLTL